MQIINNSNFTLTHEQLFTIVNLAKDYDCVEIGIAFEDEEIDGMIWLPVYDINGEFIFNLSTQTIFS